MEEQTIIKRIIEKLRLISIQTQKMYDTGYFTSEAFDDIEGNAVSIAYDLLQQMYNTNGDEEETIFEEFNKYMYGEKYENLDEFLKWLDEV